MISIRTALAAALAHLVPRPVVDTPPRDTSLPLGTCVRPGHPHECAADPKVGCVRWKAAR